MADVVVDRAAYQWAEAERARLETENKQLHDLGRELYEALGIAFTYVPYPTSAGISTDSAPGVEKRRVRIEAALARYERETGT